MRTLSTPNWQHPWREVLGTLLVVQVKFTLEEARKAQKGSRDVVLLSL